MGHHISERVGAFIIRKTSQHGYELLLFQHPDCPEAPLQIPGGGIDPGESIEAALYREIYEESGLTDLIMLRKLGVSSLCWITPAPLINHRHCFLLEAPPDTPEQWEHRVHGTGFDAGFRFSYFWHRPAIDFKLAGEPGIFLNADHIPELYQG